jgi:hypothetical protein
LPASRSRRYSCGLPSARRTKSLLYFQHRLGDSFIGATPTEISAHAFTHALWTVAGLTLLDQTDRTHDLARRTEPTLQAIVGKKGLLHRMKSVALRDTLDRQDVSAVVTNCKRKARIDPSPVNDDSAGAALPPVAALLGSSQFETLAKKIQEGHPRVIKLDRPHDAVYSQSR